MGVKNLYNTVNQKAPEAVTTGPDLKGKTVAIDLSIFVYKWVTAAPIENNHIRSLIFMTLNMLEYGIDPIWVFDGPKPSIKKSRVRTTPVTKWHFIECKFVCSLLGVKYIESIGEAEAECAALVQSGTVWAVVTEDSDCIPFGAARILRNVKASKNYKNVSLIELDKIIAGLDVTLDQLRIACSMALNDYIPEKEALTIKGAIKAVKKGEYTLTASHQLALEMYTNPLTGGTIVHDPINKEKLINELYKYKFGHKTIQGFVGRLDKLVDRTGRLTVRTA